VFEFFLIEISNHIDACCMLASLFRMGQTWNMKREALNEFSFRDDASAMFSNMFSLKSGLLNKYKKLKVLEKVKEM